jgi:hypothetical protein
MEWEYLVEEVPASMDSFMHNLTDAGSKEWEAVTTWVIQGDPHINKGASKTFILYKRPKKRAT